MMRRAFLCLTFFLWLFFLLTLSLAAGDLQIFGFFEEERWYSITMNSAFLLLTTAQISSSRQSRTKKMASAAIFSAAFFSLAIATGLEAPVLAIFGSPSWESVQAWARKNHPESAWVEEPFRVPRSACGPYCQDIHTWEKIRAIGLE